MYSAISLVEKPVYTYYYYTEVKAMNSLNLIANRLLLSVQNNTPISFYSEKNHVPSKESAKPEGREPNPLKGVACYA